MKIKAASEIGIAAQHIKLGNQSTQQEVHIHFITKTVLLTTLNFDFNFRPLISAYPNALKRVSVDMTSPFDNYFIVRSKR